MNSDIADKLVTIAENQKAVYEAGKAAGGGGGGDTDAAYQQGVTDGKQAEYDRFWDAYQDNGNRTAYFQAFSGIGWTDETFKPKYKIKPTGDASSVFYLNQATAPLTADMVDFSGATGFYNTFRGAQFKEIELIDFSGSNQVFSYTFDSAATEKIGLLILSDIATAKVNTTTFNKMPNLSYIRIQGTFAQGFTMAWSPLSVESMKSIISALKNFTGTGNEYTQTVKFSDACWEALEADSSAPDGSAWKEYVYITLCWNT